MPGGSFTADITAIRERARQRIEEGPVTGSYGKDPEDVVAVLNELLATEIVCWMRAAERISQHTTYETHPDEDLEGMLRDNLTAERIVITTYQELIRWLGDGDPTARRLLEGILADEDEHADDLVDLLGA
jgi:bacterioferritin